MRVFVAGSTGVLGRALLPELAAGGYQTVALARTEEKLALASSLGACAVQGNLLDRDRLRAIIAEHRPDAIVNLATAIPLKLKTSLDDWQENDRVREAGSANLIEAARQAPPQVFIQESVGYVYEPRGDEWITEERPLSHHPLRAATLRMERYAERCGLRVAILRFGALNSSDAWHTRQMIGLLRNGMMPVVGDPWVSQVHARDAAGGVLCALRNPGAAAGNTFNIVDSEPVRMRELLYFVAELLHAPKPRRAPAVLAKMLVGEISFSVFSSSYRISNRKARDLLGFKPTFPSYRESWNNIVAEAAA